MPTYEYVCDACAHELEAFQSMKDDPLTKCPACNKKKLRRRISAGAGFIFKGSGFYITDYRSSAYQEAAAKDSKDSKASESGEAGKPADSAAAPEKQDKSRTAERPDKPDTPENQSSQETRPPAAPSRSARPSPASPASPGGPAKGRKPAPGKGRRKG
jgi:putative FmdB family regulatory protein